MATRRLEVDLVVDDSQARSAFARTGRSVSVLEQQFGRSGAAISRAAGAASTRISQIGSAAKTAAPFVAGGLALGLGKAVAEAREAEKAMGQTEAVIKSTGGAANVTAGQVAALSERISEKAAIDDETIQSGANLLLTFKNLRNEAGEGNKIFNQSTSIITDMSVALDTDLKSAAIQVGKALNDPTVGLTALSRAGVTFTTQEKEKIQALFESGEQLKAQKMILAELTTEFKGSAAAQADAGDRIGVVFDNLAEDIGLKILPGLEELGNEISDVLSSKKLTGEEKAGKLGEILQERVQDGIDALSEVAPEAAAAGAKIMGALVAGAAEAWWESDVLGKLFLTGAFIRVIGGPGALGGLGKAIGGRLVSTMATTIAADLAAETAAANAMGQNSSKWGGLGRSIGRRIGPAMGAAGAVGFLAYFQDDIQKAIGAGQSDPIFSNLMNDEAFGWLGDLVGAGDEASDSVGKSMGEIVDSLEGAGKQGRQTARMLTNAYDLISTNAKEAADNVGDSAAKGARALDDLSKKGSRDLDKVGDSADRNAGKRAPTALGEMVDSLGKGDKATDKFADGATRNLDKVGDSSKKQGARVADNTASMVNAVLDGYGILGKETKDALKAFGVNKTAYSVGKSVAKGAAGVDFKQQGGMVVPGHGTGDIFGPALLPAGGFVLNRDANNAFFGLQSGGVVPTMLEPGERFFPQATPTLQLMNELVPRRLREGGFVHPAGTPGSAVVNAAIADQVAAWLSRYGMTLTAGYDPGGGHVSPGHNETGTALDTVPTAGWGSGPTRIFESGLTAAIQAGKTVLYGSHGVGTPYPNHGYGNHAHTEWGMGGAVAGGAAAKIARLLLKGPRGQLRSMGQGGLDMTRAAAMKWLASQTVSFPGASISGDGDVERVFAQVAKKLSNSKTATLALGMAGYAESGMRDLDYGDSSSLGALQLLASTASGMGIDPHNEGQVASAFLTRGYYGKGGANSLAAQGLPAHLVAQGVQGSAFPDGSNYAAQAGPAKAWMSRYGLQSGGRVARTTPLDTKISDLADLIRSLTVGPSTFSGSPTGGGPMGFYAPGYPKGPGMSVNAPTGLGATFTPDATAIVEALEAQLEEMKAAREALDEIRQAQEDERRRAEQGSGVTREQILDAIGTTVDERLGVGGVAGRRMAGVGTLGTGSF